MKSINLATLEAAYIALLLIENERFRAINQGAYCEIRDAIAESIGASSEAIQVAFEGMARDVKNRKYGH